MRVRRPAHARSSRMKTSMSNDLDQPQAGLLGRSSRRRLIERAGIGALAAGALATGVGRASPAAAATTTTDIDPGILNFALNLEYLEGEFYSRAVFGYGLQNIGTNSTVIGGSPVPNMEPMLRQLAIEIATDETNHVNFLRSQLGAAAVPEPNIDFTNTFLALGQAIGVSNFDPFADQLSFLIGAFIFEDVGVTAYNGAAPLITSPAYLGAAASILAVEAYHAAGLRTLLYQANASNVTDAIAAYRAKAAGTGPGTSLPADDQGTTLNGQVNLVPTDGNSLVFARTPQQVLAIVYNGGTTSGGFFPNGVHGMFTSTMG